MALTCTRQRFCPSALRDDWNRVYDNSANDSPFLTWEFVELWDRCFSAEGALWLYGVYNNGEPVGFLPLFRKNRLYYADKMERVKNGKAEGNVSGVFLCPLFLTVKENIGICYGEWRHQRDCRLSEKKGRYPCPGDDGVKYGGLDVY